MAPLPELGPASGDPHFRLQPYNMKQAQKLKRRWLQLKFTYFALLTNHRCSGLAALDAVRFNCGVDSSRTHTLTRIACRPVTTFQI